MKTDQQKIRNVVLADDDADDCLVFEDALREVNIHTLLTVSNDGVELMTALEENVTEPPPPDVIFLDLNMPRKNGFECLDEIRDTPKLKNIPIVIFSTSSSRDAVEKAYKKGANHYICKPSSYELLKKSIEYVLNLDLWNKPQPPKDKFLLAIQ